MILYFFCRRVSIRYLFRYLRNSLHHRNSLSCFLRQYLVLCGQHCGTHFLTRYFGIKKKRKMRTAGQLNSCHAIRFRSVQDRLCFYRSTVARSILMDLNSSPDICFRIFNSMTCCFFPVVDYRQYINQCVTLRLSC